MTLSTTLSRWGVAAALLVLPALSQATNGYFAHGYGTKDDALAGAGVALPQDSLAAATNPAGMVLVGNRMDLGAALFSPHRQYTVSAISGGLGANGGTSGSNVESDSNYFLIPHFGRNWMLDSQSSFGISVYGNGGMNTDYSASNTPFGAGTFGGGDAGVNLAQLFIAPTYAHKFGSTGAWGISPIIAYQTFAAKGLSAFAPLSTDPSHLTNKGYDSAFGYGVRLGILGKVSPAVTLAASYQSRIYMGKFGKYAGLFADKGAFDIPPSATAGLAWAVTSQGTFVLDVQWTGYSQIDSIADPMLPNLANCMGGNASYCLGGSNGIGFGWGDMTTWKLGYQWHTSPAWTWRVGYSHGNQPIPSSEVLFNILAPGVMEDHLTFGFTRQLNPKHQFSFALMYAPTHEVKGTNPLGAPAGQSVKLKMYEYQLEGSWGWRF